MTFGLVPPGGLGFGRLSFGMLVRGGRHCLPSQVQPFLLHSAAGFGGGRQILALLFHTKPFFLHSLAGFTGGNAALAVPSPALLPAFVSGFGGGNQFLSLAFQTRPFWLH
jgi:hypothetical protein